MKNVVFWDIKTQFVLHRMGEKRNVYRLLVGKPEGKRPLGRPRRRWMDNIKMDLLEIGLNVVDSESSCKLGNEPSGSINCWELPSGCTTCGLTSGTQLHRRHITSPLQSTAC
jgi:hypothetical protein